MTFQGGIHVYKCTELLSCESKRGLFHAIIILRGGSDKTCLGKAVDYQGLLNILPGYLEHMHRVEQVIDLAKLLTVSLLLESMHVTIVETIFHL